MNTDKPQEPRSQAREVRPDPNIRSPASFIAPIALILCVAAGLAMPWFPVAQGVSLALALVFILAVLRMGWRMFRYRCPACGLRLTDAIYLPPDDGCPIHYYCPRCNIEWDTGWRAGGLGD